MDLSYRAFADAIQLARAEYVQRELMGPRVVGVAIVDIEKFWISALALRSLGLTILPIRSPEVLTELTHSGFKIVVGQESWTALKESCREQNLTLVPLPSLAEPASAVEAPAITDGGHILLSSGTTGRSKMVLYKSQADEAAWKWRTRVDAATMCHVFDYGPWTGAGYKAPTQVWAHGGGIIVHQQGKRHEALCDLEGTQATLLPAFLSEILAAPEGAFPRNESLQVILGGGTVTAAEISDAKRRISPHILNALTATEVGRIASTPLNDPEDQRWHCIHPGRVVQIVDEEDQPVLIGQVGRMRVLAGEGPSEYYNDPEATTAFFREGYFYPGDLAVAREDGRIALQGRTTEVINVKGTKVGPAQFEDQIREMYGFTGVCLLSAQDGHGEEQLYVVVETPQPLEQPVIKSLERIMKDVTMTVCTIAALPRTGTGKVIRTQVQAQVLAAAGTLARKTP